MSAPEPSTDLYRQVFDAVPEALYLTRAEDGTVLLVNAAAEETLGYSEAEMVGRSVAELDLWVDVHQRTEMLALLEAQGRVDGFAARLRRRDGRVIDVLSSIQVIEVEGEACLATVTYDITEHTRAEEALHRSEQRLRQITESIDEGFVLAGLAPLRVLYASSRYAELLGTTVEDVYASATEILDTIHPDDVEAVRSIRDQIVAGQRLGEMEFRVRLPDEGERWARFRWTAVEDEEGPRDLIAGVVDDITARKRADREIALARAEAEEASRAKSTFLSRVSHELRTPLNVILGFGQLLGIDDLRPEQHEALDEIMAAGQHLLHLVDEVLDISRAETGDLDLAEVPVAVADVVGRVVERFAPEAARRGIELRDDGTCTARVLGDGRRLEEALGQLVENAVIHNVLSGSVDVRCATRPGDRVRITVQDTGPGLHPEELERIYLPFERTRGSDGTGLGLPLARRLVEAMGGELGARSVPGRGSEFWIDLEAAPPGPGHRPGPRVEPADRDRRVLYIEDNASNAELAARALGSRDGISLTIAPRGEEGLTRLADEPYDLVLLDLHLPDISGEEILRRIRADEATAGLPVVVISADASPDVVSRVLAGGAVEYLTKPINIAHLIRVVERRAGVPPTPSRAPVPRLAPPRPPAPPAVGTGPTGILDDTVLESLQVLEEIEAGTIGDLVDLFARAGADRVAQMEALAAAGAVDGLAELAHALRGSGANLGAHHLALLCHQLERAGRDGDAGRAHELVHEVRRSFDASLACLAERTGRPPPGGG